MSRVMWGVVSKTTLEEGRTAKKWQQTTLSKPVPPPQQQLQQGPSTSPPSRGTPCADATTGHKRARVEDGGAPPTTGGGNIGFLDDRPDDGILFGPSGGGNRETQGRRGPRPYFNNGVGARPAVFDRQDVSPYSREHIAGVREVRTADAQDRQRRGDMRCATTEFDEALLEPFLPSPPTECPRDIFQGRCFFLNSCDADPHVTTYILEKLIRRLGGVTSMSVSGLVSYVVTQHLSSAKEIKLVKRGTAPTTATRRAVGGGPRYIHPHFVLACAKEGRLVAEGPYLTMHLALGSASRNVANAVVPHHQQEGKSDGDTSQEVVEVGSSASAATRTSQAEGGVVDDDDDCVVLVGTSSCPAVADRVSRSSHRGGHATTRSGGSAVIDVG